MSLEDALDEEWLDTAGPDDWADADELIKLIREAEEVDAALYRQEVEDDC